ncbi:flagellar filament capping protein FliD [Fulvimonas soli]|uniref:Flagellar hook-associated protein 2 n=1 Tax=Fulvimonas soli TaxID=155197 RepID=A0A316HRL7_9GAMM|nr:flagellar filament capping protein FliD [Fulvimonas soli]PWK83086.1 flagellar hook-associated protein 2 [Fulvimonas soli]
MTTISSLNSTTTGTSNSSGSSTSSSSSSSAVLSSAGIGSGLDVDAIVTALVNAKKAGPSQQISNQTTQLQAQEAGLTALGSALNSLQSTLDKLASSITYNTYSATLSDTALGTTSTLPNAQPGTYKVVVDHLATAQKRASDAYPAGSTVGAGTLTISVGGKSMDLAVSGTDSLGSLATAINQSADNPGVQATVVNGASGAQLLLTSTKTGVANAFTVSASADSDSGLSALAARLDAAGDNEARDASLSIDGIAVTSASNSVSGVLNGVTLNLAATGSATLTVSQDTSAVESALDDFVSAYNSYASTVSTLSSYDQDSKTAGVLLGDTTLLSIQRQINSVLSGKVAGNAIGSLAALGVTRNADGTLSLDSGKLGDALKDNPGAVQDLFAGANGYATRLNSALDGFTASDGIIATRTASIEKQLTSLSKKSADLDARMSAYEAQLRQQYTALDTLMSSLNNTSSYLTSALKQLEDSYTSSDN